MVIHSINNINDDDAVFYPCVLQGKFGASLNLGNTVPYFSYSYSYFVKKAAEKAATKLGVYRAYTSNHILQWLEKLMV